MFVVLNLPPDTPGLTSRQRRHVHTQYYRLRTQQQVPRDSAPLTSLGETRPQVRPMRPPRPPFSSQGAELITPAPASESSSNAALSISAVFLKACVQHPTIVTLQVAHLRWETFPWQSAYSHPLRTAASPHPDLHVVEEDIASTQCRAMCDVMAINVRHGHNGLQQPFPMEGRCDSSGLRDDQGLQTPAVGVLKEESGRKRGVPSKMSASSTLMLLEAGEEDALDNTGLQAQSLRVFCALRRSAPRHLLVSGWPGRAQSGRALSGARRAVR
ncbi:hypothetical protein BBAD15_g6330 [Beauveria bassiana D1-5]|uniref:Uncharacterized protein n=1 Tax=Beauveria bassiana D1-5 TaxID=1245745 RepID=A0A0A2VQD6_BEABA|nr:hypothetical protein BBAD15_g6330 [Beauveria bassiana D1-5]